MGDLDWCPRGGSRKLAARDDFQHDGDRRQLLCRHVDPSCIEPNFPFALLKTRGTHTKCWSLPRIASLSDSRSCDDGTHQDQHQANTLDIHSTSQLQCDSTVIVLGRKNQSGDNGQSFNNSNVTHVFATLRNNNAVLVSMKACHAR